MVLLLKQWKSRSSPGFEASVVQEPIRNINTMPLPGNSQRRLLCLTGQGPTTPQGFARPIGRSFVWCRSGVPARMKRAGSPARLIAGWSSPVARQAHNLKVAGSNPAPATNHRPSWPAAPPSKRGFFSFEDRRHDEHFWHHRAPGRPNDP
jgi:hypothetical protein